MFEQALYETISTNFTLTGFNLEFGFGEIEESAKEPYIIQFSLDSSGDSNFLCNDNDFTDGEAFIQWTVYSKDASNAFYIKQELMKYIGQLRNVSSGDNDYMIQLNQAESSPSGTTDTNGLFADIVTRSFTYNIGD